jgi:S-DNA-T family DNA segregation ATPase FtsK/SpoIIIE
VLGRVVKVHPGPVITMYEFEPAPGVKVSRIVNLSDDLALALRAISVRIVAPIPGKNVVGIEVPNVERDVVVLRDVVAHASFQETEARIPIALGKDIFGNPVTTDLAAMPHLLVAGATGTGKSVFLNALLCSILMRATPDDVKLLLVDPKMLEFSLYQGIPHLIAEVVTNPKRAAAALLGVVGKMEERYRLMAQKGVRNIEQYNKAVARDLAASRPKPDDEIVPKKLPYIVVVIDELADLMIVAARDVEESLMRLAQMARAAGIHLVLATQRPSVDVLTGIIKANFPSRISFQVSSRTDSRTVLDANGAERLLGQGDLLHVPPGSSKLERIHGPYISEKEVQAVTEWVRQQGSPEFDPTLVRLNEESEKSEERGEELDELFDQAVEIVARHRIASISFVQRKLKIGYNRSARILEQMEHERIVGPQEGTKPREIFVRPPDD